MAGSKTTKFSKDRQPAKRRGPSKRTLMIDAIKSKCGSEKEFLERVVEIGMGAPPSAENPDGLAPNPQVLSLALQRLEPALKPVQPAVTFELSEDANPHEQAKQVMQAASKGEISPEVAKIFLDGLGMMLKIEEVTELKDRLERLEASLAE